MVNMLKEILRDALCTGKQLGFLLLLAVGVSLIVATPIWVLVWLLGGIK
jgi:uncharacterized membrane protein